MKARWSKWHTGTGGERLALPAAQEPVLKQVDGKKRFVQVVTDLSRAFALCAASKEATEIRDDIAFFQTVQVALAKRMGPGDRSPEYRRRSAPAGGQGSSCLRTASSTSSPRPA